MNSDLFVFVMSGGTGERFWPLSREHQPKHLLKLLSDKTLLEETVQRVSRSAPKENIFVLTNHAQLDATMRALPSLPQENIIAEPAKRDTAPAAALATAAAYRRSANATVVVLPADAMIKDVETFERQLADSAEVAQRENAFVTFSIKPTRPSTAYGYLEQGELLPPALNGSVVHRVVRFVEKPDRDTAMRYLEGGRHFWNSGIFVWRASVFLAEAERLLPQLAYFIHHFPAENSEHYIEQNFPKLPKISVDYAVMEKAQHVCTLLAEFDWDDVGIWSSIPHHMGSNEDRNTFRGSVVSHDSEHNVAISTGRTIALCGVKDLIIVETPDAVLVCHRDAAQEIKQLHSLLPKALH